MVPNPELVMFELKINIPSSDFDSDFSTGKCTSTKCPNPPDDVTGNPFGIFLKRAELELCELKSASHCVIYLALELESISVKELSINISVSNVDCKIQTSEAWSNKQCEIDQYKT